MSADRFREISTTLLGGMLGLMSAFPLVGNQSRLAALAICVFFGALGIVAGYRRRQSVLFFYFLLIGVVTMASILSRMLFSAEFDISTS
ncbi:MAG: hypothetical protein K1X83_07240 [Oligoflexia bacterium]|nr:hypothetical protein [Oligoflexia bacterium]